MVLTAKQQLVYDMRFKQGKSQKQIAHELNKAPPSVCRILSRAVRRLNEVAAHFPCQHDCPYLEAVTT